MFLLFFVYLCVSLPEEEVVGNVEWEEERGEGSEWILSLCLCCPFLRVKGSEMVG